MTFALGMLFLTVVSALWPEGARVLDKLTAFDGCSQIEDSLETLTLELRSGTGFADAVAVFCRDVVELGIKNAA